MELAGYLAVAKRWWTTLLIATWVAGLAGYVISSGVPPTYEGTTRLLVGPVVGDVDVTRAAEAISYTYAELATSGPAIESVRSELNLPAEPDIVARAIPHERTRILEIRAEYGDAETAADIANALAEQLIARESSGVILPEGQLSVVEAAVPLPRPIAPQVTLIAIIAAGVGLLAAVVLVVLVEYFGNTINSRRELGEVASVPNLGYASLGPRFRPTQGALTIVEAQPESRAASSVRLLATKLAYSKPDEPTSSILIVGSSPRDGSADLALGVATSLSRAGRKVIVVDASEETGELSHIAGIGGLPGLSELLEDPKAAVHDLVISRPRGPALLGRGQSTRVDLVDLDAAEAAITKLRKDYEVVIIAAAPIHLSGNALVWARAVDTVVLAAERERSRRDDVAYAMDNLVAVHASVLGSVLLDRAPRSRRTSSTSQRGNRQAYGPMSPKPDSTSVRRSDELGH